MVFSGRSPFGKTAGRQVRRVRKLSEKELSHLRSIKYSALGNERIIKKIAHGKIIRIFSKTIDHLYERKSVVVGHELLAEALNQGMKNARAEDLKQALKNNKELILRYVSAFER